MEPTYDANQAIQNYDGILQGASINRMELEDTFSTGLEEFVQDVTGMKMKDLDQKTLAGMATHSLVYSALMNEGEEGLATEYKSAISGGGDYSEVLAKVKDTQILQTKYGVQNVLDVQKQMEALAASGKLTSKTAKTQIEQYAGQRVISDAQTAMGMVAETADGVDLANQYLAQHAEGLGVAYFDASSAPEAQSKGVNMLQTDLQIKQSLENRVV